MKSKALLISSIFFLIFVTMDSKSIGEIGLIDQKMTHSIYEEASGQPLSFFESFDLNILKDLELIERDGKALVPDTNVPFTFLLLLSFFGFAFWCRSSLKK